MSLWKELSGYFAQPEVKAKLAEDLNTVAEPERRTFLMANLVAEQLAFRFFKKFVQQLSDGNLVESIQALSAIAPILIILAPYIYGFSSQAPSRTWLRGIFNDEYGVHPRDIKWRNGGLEEPGREERTPIKLPAEVELKSIPGDRTLSDMLEKGEIVESGTHAELMKLGRRYKELHDRQYGIETDIYVNPGEDFLPVPESPTAAIIAPARSGGAL